MTHKNTRHIIIPPNITRVPTFGDEDLEVLKRKMDSLPSIEEGNQDENQEEQLEGNQATSQDIIPIQPPNLGDVFFLSGDFGKKVHEKVIQKYSDIEAITKVVYNPDEAIVKGSNPFYVVAVNEVLRKLTDKKIRTATQADLEEILRRNNLSLEGNYEDSGLVWRNNEDPNKYLAQNIYNQFQQKNISLKEATAYLIQLQKLSLAKDNNSPHKLSFILPEKRILQSEYFEAPILNSPNNKKYNSPDINPNTGLPKYFSNSGTRTLYTGQEGLSGLYLYRSLNLYSYNGDLARSYVSGRVVCIAAEGRGIINNSGGKQ